jgi:hypothetical protein
MRLFAIVLRTDLRSGGGVYGGGDAGEGRFVFSVHDGSCSKERMTVILEYRAPISCCADVRQWARDWIDLESSADYNQDLEALNDVFAVANADPSAPNGSAIGQVRTDELLPGGPVWDLRELVLPGSGGSLVQTDVKQETDPGFNGSPDLADRMDAKRTSDVRIAQFPSTVYSELSFALYPQFKQQNKGADHGTLRLFLLQDPQGRYRRKRFRSPHRWIRYPARHTRQCRGLSLRRRLPGNDRRHGAVARAQALAEQRQESAGADPRPLHGVRGLLGGADLLLSR